MRLNITLTKTIKKTVITAIVFMAAMPLSAQDLLARQAPVDRKMKTVDTLALQSIIERENTESPAASLYEDWNNRYAHRATALPDQFRVDLRNFCMPTPSRVITSNFGSRWGRMHKGIDLKVYIGDTIRAAFSGKVRIVRYEAAGYGKYIVIRHYNGLETIYGHLSKQIVQENQTVKAGEPIGLGGNTGRSTGSHLHFETRLCGVALNPALMFDFRNQDVTGDFYTFVKATNDEQSEEANRLRGKVGNGGYASADVTGESLTDMQIPDYVEPRYHKVVAGETLSSIAKKRGVSVSTICKLNHIGAKMRVHPGQILRYS